MNSRYGGGYSQIKNYSTPTVKVIMVPVSQITEAEKQAAAAALAKGVPLPLSVYSPYPFTANWKNLDDTTSTVFGGTPAYYYLNLLDLMEKTQTLTFNTTRMFLQDETTTTPSVNVSLGLYRLTNGVEPGPTTQATYPANSKLISSTSFVSLTENGFFDVTWPKSITITPSDSVGTNNYFLAVLTNVDAPFLGVGDPVPFNTIPWIFQSTNTTVTTLPPTILTPDGIEIRPFIYYTLY